MRLLAGVLHSDEIAWNSYTWDADAHKQINTNQQKTADKIGRFSLETTDQVTNFDNMIEGVYRILTGIIGNTGYVSIDFNWIRMQFRCNSDDTVQCRIIYGSHSAHAWVKIV